MARLAVKRCAARARLQACETRHQRVAVAMKIVSQTASQGGGGRRTSRKPLRFGPRETPLRNSPWGARLGLSRDLAAAGFPTDLGTGFAVTGLATYEYIQWVRAWCGKQSALLSPVRDHDVRRSSTIDNPPALVLAWAAAPWASAVFFRPPAPRAGCIGGQGCAQEVPSSRDPINNRSASSDR